MTDNSPEFGVVEFVHNDQSLSGMPCVIKICKLYLGTNIFCTVGGQDFGFK